jgi:hypothetical protein
VGQASVIDSYSEHAFMLILRYFTWMEVSIVFFLCVPWFGLVCFFGLAL